MTTNYKEMNITVENVSERDFEMEQLISKFEESNRLCHSSVDFYKPLILKTVKEKFNAINEQLSSLCEIMAKCEVKTVQIQTYNFYFILNYKGKYFVGDCAFIVSSDYDNVPIANRAYLTDPCSFVAHWNDYKCFALLRDEVMKQIQKNIKQNCEEAKQWEKDYNTFINK